MGVAASEGIEKEVRALAGFQGLGEQVVGAGQRRPLPLDIQQRLQQPHFRTLVTLGLRIFEQGQNMLGQGVRKRHAAGAPAWDGGLATAGAAHV